jgi:N-acetylated-alpha-linked acidic dipeptidase
VPTLKQFLRELTRSVPSPLGGTVYQQWRIKSAGASNAQPTPGEEIHVGDLGSGSDFTPFFQHVGVPSTDIGSDGPYGVYHSVFDNYAWYTLNADPNFVYLQEMARVLGLEALRMADADVLPYDYVAYAAAISSYIDAAKNKAAGDSTQEKNASDSSERTTKKWWKISEPKSGTLDFSAVQAASARFSAAAERAHGAQIAASGDLAKLNLALRQAETGLISEQGLPNRPWYRHTIYAPGEFTGYSAVVIPGVNEAIDAHDLKLATQQLTVLTQALTRAAQTLEGAR